jgi:hypothetical protein
MEHSTSDTSHAPSTLSATTRGQRLYPFSDLVSYLFAIFLRWVVCNYCVLDYSSILSYNVEEQKKDFLVVLSRFGAQMDCSLINGLQRSHEPATQTGNVTFLRYPMDIDSYTVFLLPRASWSTKALPYGTSRPASVFSSFFSIALINVWYGVNAPRALRMCALMI